MYSIWNNYDSFKQKLNPFAVYPLTSHNILQSLQTEAQTFPHHRKSVPHCCQNPVLRKRYWRIEQKNKISCIVKDIKWIDQITNSWRACRSPAYFRWFLSLFSRKQFFIESEGLISMCSPLSICKFFFGMQFKIANEQELAWSSDFFFLQRPMTLQTMCLQGKPDGLFQMRWLKPQSGLCF